MSGPWKHPDSDVYYFRRAVPDDIRKIVGGGWERKQSLRTKDPVEARRKYTAVADQVEKEWADLRRRSTAPQLTDLDAVTIKRAGEAYYAFLLEEDEDRRLDGFMTSDALPETPTPTFEEHADTEAEFEADAKHGWARGELHRHPAGSSLPESYKPPSSAQARQSASATKVNP